MRSFINRIVFFVTFGMLAVTGVASAEQYVGGNRTEAVYIAWTADDNGHLQGQVQVISLNQSNPSKTNATNASFAGNRSGSNVSLVFPMLSAFGGSTWTGRIGGQALSLDIPTTNGTPTELVLAVGSFQDFQHRVISLQERAGTIGTTQSFAKAVQETALQIVNESNTLIAADKSLRHTFGTAQSPSTEEQSFNPQFAKAWAKMQEDWAREQKAGTVVPMTCYEKGHVQYAASSVAYDRDAIRYLSSSFASFEEGAKRNIETVVQGPAVARNLLAVLSRRARAWEQNTGKHFPEGLDMLSAQADKAATFAREVASVRLANDRNVVQDYERRATDLNKRAAQFFDSVTCPG